MYYYKVGDNIETFFLFDMMRSGDATCKKDCVEWGESVYRFCIFLNWGICVIGFQGNPETAVYPFNDHGTDRLGMWILKDWEHPIHLAKVEAIHWAETCVPQRPQCIIFWDPFFFNHGHFLVIDFIIHLTYT